MVIQKRTGGVRSIRMLLMIGIALSSLMGCSDSDSTDSVNISRVYQGGWGSIGTGTLALRQVDSALTGTLTFANAACVRQGILNGTRNGSELEGTVDFGGGIVMRLTASVAIDIPSSPAIFDTPTIASISGEYVFTTNATACAQNRGQFFVTPL